MKESIHTIPLMDAFKAEDECPFCYLEREAEQHAISFALGSGASYMEDDVRAETDAMGFCRHHYKMMYDLRKPSRKRFDFIYPSEKTEPGACRTDGSVCTGKILGVQADAEDIPRQTGP